MDIVMIRHGQSEDNLLRLYGSKDTSLSKKGIEEIKAIRDILANYNFSKVYLSPLERTRETLKYLDLNMEAIEDERIGEYDFGIFSGLSNEEIEANYPLEYGKWVESPFDYKIPQGESLQLVYDRLVDFLEEALEKDEDILLVTHEGIIRLVLSWVFNNIEYFFRFKIDNGSISLVAIEDNYKFIKEVNYKKK